jgi:hypothetical protein
MESYFEKIIPDYTSGEITCLFLHDRDTDKCYNLLAIFELVPAEQQSSLLIGSKETSWLDRKSLDDRYSIYIGRITSLQAEEAVNFFQRVETGFTLEYPGVLKKDIHLFDGGKLEQEPPGEYPLIIDQQTERTIGVILPYRPTDFRVWSKIDRQKKWLAGFDQEQKKSLLQKAGKLTMLHIGFDIAKLEEHLGNVYLCCCNPYIRNYECTLLDYNKDLLLQFREREGKTIIGKTIILEDKRADNYGFSIELKIRSVNERIQLPHFPDRLVTKIFDANGFLIENHLGTWMNISVGINMQETVVSLELSDGKKTESIEVPKYGTETPVNIGTYDHSLTYYLKERQRGREIEDLADRKEFIFFPGSEADKKRAQEIIGELLNKAKRRCMLLDPYFGSVDLRFAFIVSNLSVPIQIISSAAFLKNEIEETTVSHGEALLSALDQYLKIFPRQPINCKVLKGKKSPLHDRYIVVDEQVYLLGSSFNEFGTRATTLIKVPAPETMIRQAIEWWDDNTKLIELKEFVTELKKAPDEGQRD